MKVKKKSVAWLALDFVKSYWVILGLFGTIAGTAIAIPGRLTANEKRTEALEGWQKRTQEYVDAIEDQKKLIKKSPPGYRWDEVAEEYIPYPEDPRLKRKK